MLRRLLALPLVPVVALTALIPAPKSWFYQSRRPTRLGRAVNRTWCWMAGAGLTPPSWPGKPRIGTIAVETRGRRSGRARSQVVTWVEHEGARYLVSMLGEVSDWVRNARAAAGEAAIRHGSRRPVRLEEVPPDRRAPILQAYLKRTAISTAYHLGLKPDAPVEEFQHVAGRHPVFRIVERD